MIMRTNRLAPYVEQNEFEGKQEKNETLRANAAVVKNQTVNSTGGLKAKRCRNLGKGQGKF